MAGEGKLLKEAREKNGWSYQDVEDRIKIRANYLRALEEEDYDVLPGAVYSKGFLRTYAKLLGLNEQDIIDHFNSSLHQETEPLANPPLTPIQNTPVWFKPVVLLVMGLLAVAIVIGITYCSRINQSPEVSDYKPAPLPTAPQESTPLQTTPSAPGQTPAAPDQTPAQLTPPVQQEGIVAVLTFKEDCWLEVRVDGGVTEQGLYAAGTTKTLQGSKRIEFLKIGNAGGLQLKLNGKDVPPLGKSGVVVSNYVVTEETVKNLS
jgi:cytoskeleton protein RodZ